MGKRIDRAVLWALGAAGFYLFYLNAWGGIVPACAAAFVSCALLRRLVSRVRLPVRLPRAQALEALGRVAALEDAEAGKRLGALARWRWPGETFRLTPVLKHPEAMLSSGDVLNAWKANRDAGRLVIAATCPAEPRALFYARRLDRPAVAVLDSRALTRLMRLPGAPRVTEPATPPPLRRRVRDALLRARTGRPKPKNAALGAALLALYLLRGNPLGLIGALALLWQLGSALIARRLPGRLFEL